VSNALQFIDERDVRLTLRSRANLPAVIGLRVRARNPWLSGCPTLTIAVFDRNGRKVSETRRDLRDPLLDLTPGLSCLADFDLPLRGAPGPYTFAVQTEDGHLLVSEPFPINDLDDSAPVAEDETDGFVEQAVDEIQETVGKVGGLLMAGALLVGAVVVLPKLAAFLPDDD